MPSSEPQILKHRLQIMDERGSHCRSITPQFPFNDLSTEFANSQKGQHLIVWVT